MRRWTTEEDALLRTYYPTKGAGPLVKSLNNRSKDAIQTHARKLGVRREDTRWTAEEHATIREFYPQGGAEEVHKYLPRRTLATIGTQAHKIGCRGPVHWAPEEVALLRRFVETHDSWQGVEEAVGTRSACACQRQAAWLGLPALLRKCDWTEEENRTLLRTYAEGGSARDVYEELPRRTLGSIRSHACLLHVTNPLDTKPFRTMFTGYRLNAKRKKRPWELTLDDVAVLAVLPCAYCGVSFSNQNRAERYNGIDRVDNERGYTSDNVVACCRTCNVAKGATPYVEWIEWLDCLVDFRTKKEETQWTATQRSVPALKQDTKSTASTACP